MTVPKSATVVITTKNRKGDLRRVVESCLRQTIPVEVLVIDDGSTDGTSEMLRAEFPMVNLQRREESRGLIARRNESARLAGGEIIFSIDDDAEFSAPDIVARILADFDDIRVAAVAIPFINVNREREVKQGAPDDSRIWVTSEYIGTAHALRRDAFNRLGGYREFLFHQEEEPDFCIRLLSTGSFVRLGRSAPIFHHESPLRSHERINVFGQRNLILFTWYNVPLVMLPVHLLATIFNGLRWGLRQGTLRHRVRGTFRGFAAVCQQLDQRRPVPLRAYFLYRRLKKHGPLELAGREDDSNFEPQARLCNKIVT